MSILKLISTSRLVALFTFTNMSIALVDSDIDCNNLYRLYRSAEKRMNEQRTKEYSTVPVVIDPKERLETQKELQEVYDKCSSKRGFLNEFFNPIDNENFARITFELAQIRQELNRKDPEAYKLFEEIVYNDNSAIAIYAWSVLYLKVNADKPDLEKDKALAFYIFCQKNNSFMFFMRDSILGNYIEEFSTIKERSYKRDDLSTTLSALLIFYSLFEAVRA